MPNLKSLEVDLLNLYRAFYDGNSSAPDGTDIRVAITRLENILKLDNKNR